MEFSMLKILQIDTFTANAKNVPYWDYMVKSLITRLEYFKKRYDLAPPAENLGVYLLKYMLGTLDLDLLLIRRNDYDMYINDINTLVPGIRGVFDPVYSGQDPYDVFSSKPGSKICDVMLNTSYEFPLSDLPMNRPYPEWKAVKPLSVIYYDSPELVYHIENMRLNFKHDAPSYVVWSINIPVLFIKYLKYVKYYRETLKQEEPRAVEFLKTEVYRLLFDDLIDIWLSNLLEHRIMHRLEPMDERYQLPNELITASERYAVKELDKWLDNLSKEYINVRDILGTKWLQYGSIVDRMKWLQRYHELPERRQYDPMTFIKEFHIVKLALQCYILANRRDKHNEIIRYLRVEVKHLMRNAMQNPILYQLGIKKVVEREFNAIQRYL